jgi:hypothetical protein
VSNDALRHEAVNAARITLRGQRCPSDDRAWFRTRAKEKRVQAQAGAEAFLETRYGRSETT